MPTYRQDLAKLDSQQDTQETLQPNASSEELAVRDWFGV